MRHRAVYVAFALLFVLGCKKPAPAPQAAVESAEVTQVDVVEEMMPRTLALNGTLRGERQTEVAANASGRVLETFVDRGSIVKEGDVLAKLDVRAQAALAAEASTNVAITNAQVDAAKRDCDRNKMLLDARAISQAEFDRVDDQCKTLPLSRQAAQTRAQAAAQTVTDGTVRAPFGGVIAERAVEVGEYVRPDSRVASLMEVDPLRLEITVPEAAAPMVKLGADLTFSVAGYPGRTFLGSVRFISPDVREATRDVIIDARVPNQDRALMPGMFADVRIESGESKEAVIPASAVVQKQGRDVVFAVVDKRLEERVVELGPTKGDKVACIRGLKAGEAVVDHPASDLWNGEAVN